jgi:hypothetical protein
MAVNVGGYFERIINQEENRTSVKGINFPRFLGDRLLPSDEANSKFWFYD